MACSVPIYYLLHRESPEGVAGLLMEPGLASALADATDPAWRPLRITFGRQTVLEGAELAAAIAEGRAAIAEGRTTIPENLVATPEGRAA